MTYKILCSLVLLIFATGIYTSKAAGPNNFQNDQQLRFADIANERDRGLLAEQDGNRGVGCCGVLHPLAKFTLSCVAVLDSYFDRYRFAKSSSNNTLAVSTKKRPKTKKE